MFINQFLKDLYINYYYYIKYLMIINFNQEFKIITIKITIITITQQRLTTITTKLKTKQKFITTITIITFKFKLIIITKITIQELNFAHQ